jgi:hypothetical protein
MVVNVLRSLKITGLKVVLVLKGFGCVASVQIVEEYWGEETIDLCFYEVGCHQPEV